MQFSAFNASYTGLPFAAINNVPNPDLRWERTGQLNIGVDVGSRNNIISGRLEYFRKKGNDLIGDGIIDPTTGISQLRGNFSDMKSHGFDIELKSVNINGSNFKWSTNLIFNYSSEKVTRFDVNYGALTYFNAFATGRPLVGKPLYSVYSYQWGGLDPATGDPRVILADTLNKTHSTQTTNNVKMQDLVYSGRYNAPIFGSLFNNFRWKGLGLTFNIIYKFNYVFRRTSINYSALASNGWKTGHKDFVLRWKQPGDEKLTNVPSIVYPANATRDAFYNQSELLIEKGDHIRLQFVNLNYEFENKLLKQISIQGLRLYFYVNNVGILWRANDKGIDPDYPFMTYPPARTYSFGIKARF